MFWIGSFAAIAFSNRYQPSRASKCYWAKIVLILVRGDVSWMPNFKRTYFSSNIKKSSKSPNIKLGPKPNLVAASVTIDKGNGFQNEEGKVKSHLTAHWGKKMGSVENRFYFKLSFFHTSLENNMADSSDVWHLWPDLFVLLTEELV